jgi:hypothetical protein
MGLALGWSGLPLERRLYDLLADSEEGISFRSFVVRMWAWMGTDLRTLNLLAFQLFDVHNRGVLDLADVRLMLFVVYGRDFQSIDAARPLYRRLAVHDLAGVAMSANVSLDDFMALASHAQGLLKPVFNVQLIIQRATLGVKAWDALTSRLRTGFEYGNFDIYLAALECNSVLGHAESLETKKKEGGDVVRTQALAGDVIRTQALASASRRQINRGQFTTRPAFFIPASEINLAPPMTLNGSQQKIELEGLSGPGVVRSRYTQTRDHSLMREIHFQEPTLIAFAASTLVTALHDGAAAVSNSRVSRRLIGMVDTVRNTLERNLARAASIAPSPIPDEQSKQLLPEFSFGLGGSINNSSLPAPITKSSLVSTASRLSNSLNSQLEGSAASRLTTASSRGYSSSSSSSSSSSIDNLQQQNKTISVASRGSNSSSRSIDNLQHLKTVISSQASASSRGSSIIE